MPRSSIDRDHGTGKASGFSHVNLENWRNFRQADVDLGRRVILVGPNASGKSNFLDVFRFLQDLVAIGGGFQAAVEKRGGIPRLRCLAARQMSDIVIRVRMFLEEKTEWEYTLRFAGKREEAPTIREEVVMRDGNQLLRRPDTDDHSDPDRLTQTHLEQISANRKFREVSDFFKLIRYLHVVPQLVREPERSIGRTEDPYGGDFLERVAKTPQRTRGARFNRILSVLKAAVPQFKQFALKRDAKGTPHLRAKYEHWRLPGAWQEEQDLSDGTIRLIGLLWAMLEEGGPLLLEEPELSLHPEVVRRMPQMFARMQQATGRQLLLSTSSADLLTDPGIGLDEVLLLAPEAEGTRVQAAADSADVRALIEGGVSMADAVLPSTAPRNAHKLTYPKP